MTSRRIAIKGIAAAALAAASPPLFAQNSQATMTVLVGAASSMDFSARLIADYLREALSRPVIAVSKLGAGGRIALAELKRSSPDGSTIMLSTSSAFVIYPNIYEKLDYDPVVDFTPIINFAWFDVAIAVGPQLGITNLQELVNWVKAQPGEVAYGCAPGTGSASHFAGIAAEVGAGIKLKPIPYKDSGQGIADTIGGRIPIMITGTTPLAAQHKAGKLRLIATSGPRRNSLVPDVPTMKESGIDTSIIINASLYGPAGMAQATVNRLYDAVSKMLADEAMRQRLALQGMTVNPMNGQELAAMLASDRELYGQLSRTSGMPLIQR